MIRKVATLAIGEFGARALGVLNFALLARALGVNGFGTLSFAMSFALIVGVAVDMGQNVHLGRVVARRGAQGAVAFAQVLRNKVLIVSLLLAPIYGGMRGFGFGHEEALLVVLMSLWAAALSVLDSERAVARAQGLMHLDSAVNSLESLARLVVVVVAWAAGLGVLGFGLVFVAEAILAALIFFFIMHRRVPLMTRAGERSEYRAFLRESATLGLVALAAAGFYRLDQVVVQGSLGAYPNGLYGAAARVIFTATAVSSIVLNAFFPSMAASASEPQRYRRVLRHTLLFAGGAGLLIALGIALFARPIVMILYGDSYAAAVPLVRIMSLVIAFNGLSAAGLYSASALNRERWSLVVVSVLAAMSFTAGLLLVPIYGVIAAACISVAGEALLAFSLLSISIDLVYLRPQESGLIP